jgi:transcriptional regulator with XRE-family HTH domain
MEVTHMEIEKKLKEARTNVGLTQEQVAEKIMVSRQTISNWENGKSLPDIVSILNLSDLYQISLDELLKGDTKMKEKIEKDVKVAKDNKRLILTTAILLVVVAIIYLISAFVGGVFYDFCEGAIRWVVLGIGVAFALTYMSQKDKVISEKKGV